MATETVVARGLILTAWRSSTVATAAGVTLSIWDDSSEAIGHVFSLSSPGAVNRGRLPVVELIFTSDVRTYLVDEGGMTDISFTARVIVGGVSNQTNMEKAEDIMQAGIYAMRNTGYFRIMDDVTSGHNKGPMYHAIEATLTAELTYEREP